MNHDLKDKRNSVIRLLRNCPLQIALPNCPVQEIRKLSSLEKFKIVAKMSKQELERTLEHHQKCFQERKNSNKETPRS
jgi:hypothetical protein